MFFQRLNQLLTDAHFHVMHFDVKEMLLFYCIEGENVYLFHICDATGRFLLNEEQFKALMRQLQNRFYLQGYRNVESLTVVLVWDVHRARHLINAGYPVWILDGLRNKLYIYDNQPSDFVGLRKQLETILDQEDPIIVRKKIRRITPVNITLVMINVLVFLVLERVGNTLDGAFMVRYGAMYMPFIVNQGEWYRLFTAMFLHFGIDHLTGNMITLLLLGDNLERAFGSWRYSVIYFVSGLGASMCSFLWNLVHGSNVVSAGASGAIFGVIGALAFTVLMNKGRLEDLSLARIGVLIAYILYSGITTPGIDNAAHIGGLILGIVLAAFLYPGAGTEDDRKRRSSLAGGRSRTI